MAPKLFSRVMLERAASEVEGCTRLAGVSPPCKVLDLCCGPGRHSAELARKGYRVTGVDRTREYLDEAGKDFPDIEFVEADMRDFRRTDSFSLVLNLYTSFGYFEDPADDRKVVENVYESLVPGGKFIMELMGKEVLARIFRERDWYEEDGIIYLEERRVLDDWKWVEARWLKLDGEKMEEYTISHRLYSARELKELLTESGFGEVEIYGSLAGISYDQNAERLVAVARKPAG
jgi:SAM-dependent methyltransferase